MLTMHKMNQTTEKSVRKKQFLCDKIRLEYVQRLFFSFFFLAFFISLLLVCDCKHLLHFSFDFRIFLLQKLLCIVHLIQFHSILLIPIRYRYAHALHCIAPSKQKLIHSKCKWEICWRSEKGRKKKRKHISKCELCSICKCKCMKHIQNII